MEHVTAIIKTFERPQFLNRLLDSVRQYYPDLPILIADDSSVPTSVKHTGVQTYRLPYDSGLSAGRNFLVDKVQTKYFLLLDDDFIFTEKTKLETLMSLLDRDIDLDIIGGEVWDRPTGPWNFNGLLATAEFKHAVKRNQWLERRDGYTVCEIIPNFFMARTERIRSVKWDPRLKLSEHVDFFVRCKGVLKVGFTSSVCIDHDRRGAPPGYSSKRGRGSMYHRIYQAKHGFKQKTETVKKRAPAHLIHPVLVTRR
jgi:glycosyltransferase involved in cell wall biosynthesis